MKKVFLTEADWKQVDCLFDAFQLLLGSGVMSVRLWRRIHCVRCREIWEYLTDVRSRTAVETAERFLCNAASFQDMQESFHPAADVVEEAWASVQSLRVASSRNVARWPISEAVDKAWIQYLAALSAKTCVETAAESVLFTTTPDTDILAWRDSRSEVIDEHAGEEISDEQFREAVLQRWDQIQRSEEKRLVNRLRELVEGLE